MRRTTLRLLLAALVAVGCAGDAEDQAENQPDADAGQADTTMDAAPDAAEGATDTGRVVVTDIGLQTPESVLHDPGADVYFVSNINGVPTDLDGNGFIARVRPNGTVEELRWVDGAAAGVTLNAPKGMALHGDTLFVADIDAVRAFDRTTGEPYGSRRVAGATFLNDLAVAPDGTLYVSDSGLNADFSPSGTAAIYRFDGDEPVAVAEGADLGSPNGIAFTREGDLVLAGFGGPQVRALKVRDAAAGGSPSSTTLAELPGGSLDGVVVLDDGSLLVSSWEGQAVYRIRAGGGEPEVIIEGVPSPADIGWDAQRRRVLIPVFQENRLIFEPVQ